MNYRLTKEQRGLRDAILKYAKENNIHVQVVVCPFTNDDVPNYLKRLKKQEEYQRKHPSKLVFKNSGLVVLLD